MNAFTRLRILSKTDRGSALVELALVMPVLLLLLFGAVDIGRAYYVGLEVANAAHAGAEFGSQYPSNAAGITAAAQQSAPELTNLVVATPTWGCECSDGSLYSANCTTSPSCTISSSRGSNVVHRVQVTASASYKPLLPWPVIPSTITLSNTATIRGN